MPEATVFIVDDDTEVRESIALLMQSVGLPSESFASAQDYLDQFDSSRPGCLVLDVRMPKMSGLELQQQLLQQAIYPPIIIITGHGDIQMAVRAVQAGAADFIEKPFRDQLLLDAIHRAITRDAEQRGVASRRSEIEQRLQRLTPREREVLDRVMQGARNKVIAFDLNISQSTVEAHRSKVMEKMQAKTLSDLMRMVLSLESGL